MSVVSGREYELKRGICLLTSQSGKIWAWFCVGRNDPTERERGSIAGAMGWI